MSILSELFNTYPALQCCERDIIRTYDALWDVYRRGGKLLLCGNGGSAADSLHIAGELMKGFLLPRPLPESDQAALQRLGEGGSLLAGRLQGALMAIPLTDQAALSTAFANDIDADLIFAQQTYALGRPGDAILGISTSGNAKNVLYALHTAKAFGLVTLGLTGSGGGAMNDICEIIIRVPATETYRIQEYHLPVYHALCAMLEQAFFG